MSDQIGVTLERTAYRPGEQLTGKAGWQLSDTPKKAHIRLFWKTSGKGTVDLKILEDRKIDAPQAAQLLDFAFALPDDPYSFEGHLITLRWGVEVVVGKATDCAWFELGPDGHTCRIGATTAR
ncbi:MAG TPA: hypothetical protein DCS43_11615 [Verrucomicrobia bacterium]|nr:hypothetical protein [Verrucomicrobiota bacterium]